MNDSQATPATSGTNEDEKSFKETVKEILSEKNDERESVLTFTSNIKELRNSNVNKTNERLDKLSAEIADLSASWEFMQKKLTRNYSGKKRNKKIADFKDKQHILNNAKKLKNTGIFIYEDFAKDTMELRKSLLEQDLEYWKQNKFACLNYRSTIVRDHNTER